MLPLRFKGRPLSVEVTREGLEFRRHGTRDVAFVSWQKAVSLGFGGNVISDREVEQHLEQRKSRTTVPSPIQIPSLNTNSIGIPDPFEAEP